jgi:hypothetical protein
MPASAPGPRGVRPKTEVAPGVRRSHPYLLSIATVHPLQSRPRAWPRRRSAPAQALQRVRGRVGADGLVAVEAARYRAAHRHRGAAPGTCRSPQPSRGANSSLTNYS